MCEDSQGWSIQSTCSIISEAGAVLDQLLVLQLAEDHEAGMASIGGGDVYCNVVLSGV